jgi:cysteine desulfurase
MKTCFMSDHNGLPTCPIYMDHHATTPVDPRVLEVMLPYFTECFGNAASVDHEYGGIAKRAVENAREQIAQLIQANSPDEIIFTSGATEADNLAILGVAEQHVNKGKHIITCLTEHHAVLDPCHYLESRGWQVTYLPVNQYGLVDLEALQKAITPQTVLISIMTANNEIGAVAPIAEIGNIARQRGVLFHTDATQAVGHIPMDVAEMNIDLLSMSAHKFYGPKGIGALYVRKVYPRVRLVSQMHGGGHERGMRSGTLNVPGIVGMGKAAEIAGMEMKAEGQRLRALRDQLWEGLQASIEGVQLNGHPTHRLPHNLNVYIPGVKSRALVVELKHELALSTGSACTTTRVEPSHVILAMGYDKERAKRSVRFGLGRSNTGEVIEYVIELLSKTANHLREIFSS